MKPAVSLSFRFVLSCWALAIFLLPVLWHGPTMAFGGRDRFFLETLAFIWAYATVFGIPVLGVGWGIFELLHGLRLRPLALYALWSLSILALITGVLCFGFTQPDDFAGLARYRPVFGAALLSLLISLPFYYKHFVPKNP